MKTENTEKPQAPVVNLYHVKHRLANWKITGQSEGGRYSIVTADTGRTVARVPRFPKEVGEGIDTDNDDARLIAAAPDLLKALLAAEQVVGEARFVEAREGSRKRASAEAVLSKIRTTLKKLRQ